MSDSQRQPPVAGPGHSQPQQPRGDRAREPDGSRTARAMEQPRSSVGINAASGEIQGKPASGAVARPSSRAAGLPPPPTGWSLPQPASAAPVWSPPAAPALAPALQGSLEMSEAPADATVPMAANIAAPMDASGSAAVPASDHDPADRREDSRDDFAQEASPVSQLPDDLTVPTPQLVRGDPTALMSEPRPDQTQIVRQRAGDLPRRPAKSGP